VHPHPLVQTLRNWGMKGFERSGPLKQWVARKAMGVPAAASNTTQP
jgi:2-polyprenyl-6-methoxyphenol hydroxylase-like FAD-dependent oxidoreductase